ncbi:ATP-dependent RecD-like DNA helicase [compost metagenome]
MTGSSHLKRQLTRYKDLLANLSRRNRELYYRETKGSSINLTKQPFAKAQFIKDTEENFLPLRFSSATFASLMSGKGIDLFEHFQLDEVKDAEAVNKLGNRIDKIRLSDDRHQREFGISGAWLLGPFLCWRTSAQASKEDLLVSPIFKIPIDLRKNKKKHIVLEVEDERISFNPSLSLCLKQKLGIEIPDFINFESIQEALSFLNTELEKMKKTALPAPSDVVSVPKLPSRYKIIKNEDGEIIERRPTVLEEVLSVQELEIFNQVTSNDFLIIDAMYLDQLNASRMVLINDYDNIIEDGIDHPILNELFNGTPLAEELVADRSKLKELDSYRERENHFVVDIDSTQHRAIDKAINSKAIVIQGPPGTGKSQTIVNLIADYLSKGKKVLFVSEKRPALDVVFNRMRSANIESQAVLIHSSDLNKSDLYKSFLELASSVPNPTDDKEWEETASMLDRVKNEINQYAEALTDQHSVSELSVADIILLKAELEGAPSHPEFSRFFGKLTYEKVQNFKNELDEIQHIFNSSPQIFNSPWAHRCSGVVKTNGLQHALGELRDQFDTFIEEDLKLRSKLQSLLGTDATPQVMDSLNQARMTEFVPVEYASLWLQNLTGLNNSLTGMLELLHTNIKHLEQNKMAFISISTDADSSVVADLEGYYRLPRGFADWFSGLYWSNRKIRMQICPQWDGSSRQFAGYREYRTSFEKTIQFGESLGLNPLLAIEDHIGTIDWLKTQTELLKRLLGFLREAESKMPLSMYEAASSSVNGFNSTITASEESKKLWSQLRAVEIKAGEEWKIFERYVSDLPEFGGFQSARAYLNTMIERIDDLTVLDNLDIRVGKMTDRYEVLGLRDIIFSRLIRFDSKWTRIVEASIINGWYDDVITKYQALRLIGHGSTGRERLLNLVNNFRVSAERHKVVSRQAVYQSFARRWSSISDRSGVPLLKKEASKERRVLSPREIMEKGALGTMLQLKPCWLMSPLSISQMLPIQKSLFDVIIFDEASQVRVEDAIPSIYRAATMIVVGDNKQMPPTSFFAGAVEDDEDEEEISPSVLDLATQVYPSVLLEWHYRSRAESLIAFSNRAFYGGRLIAAPNPKVLTEGGALKLVEVKDAYFKSKDGNAVEAEAVIDHLLNLLKEDSERSYGIIAMGQSQAAALEEALEERLKNDSRASALVEKAINYKDGEADAGLFIKNLENVQGDERDVIIMSVGYAPSEKSKKLLMNFGPLSKQGGSRRLNVAITRAKEQMYVFSSFSPSVLQTDDETFNRNPDLCVFGRYLKYVQAVSGGKLDIALGLLNSFGISGAITSRKTSRFCLDVKRRLEERGYEVSAEIGSSGFFIDLGIHHPKIPANFIVGIECDGAIFHSTPYARDRDKIREDLLKSRGWRIERVWSQDWSADWKKELDRIEKVIKTIIESSEKLNPSDLTHRFGSTR